MSQISITVRPGRHYRYKGHEYQVSALTTIKDSTQFGRGSWTQGVMYSRVDTDDAQEQGDVPESAHFTREGLDFIQKFLPVELEPGDAVEVISMGRRRGVLVVKEVLQDSDNDFCVTFENSDLLAKKFLDEDMVIVNKPEQATDYYIARPAVVNLDYALLRKQLSDYILEITDEQLKQSAIQERLKKIYLLTRQIKAISES